MPAVVETLPSRVFENKLGRAGKHTEKHTLTQTYLPKHGVIDVETKTSADAAATPSGIPGKIYEDTFVRTNNDRYNMHICIHVYTLYMQKCL